MRIVSSAGLCNRRCGFGESSAFHFPLHTHSELPTNASEDNSHKNSPTPVPSSPEFPSVLAPRPCPALLAPDPEANPVRPPPKRPRNLSWKVGRLVVREEVEEAHGEVLLLLLLRSAAVESAVVARRGEGLRKGCRTLYACVSAAVARGTADWRSGTCALRGARFQVRAAVGMKGTALQG